MASSLLHLPKSLRYISCYLSTMTQPKLTAHYVALEEVKRFICDCMTKVGVVEKHRTLFSDNLVSADYRGHYSHGLQRLEMYMRDVSSGTVNTQDTEPTVLKETISTALVDGNNLLGPVVGTFCMDLAIQKCKASGIGWVTARNSNHYGICAFYTKRATREHLIGMSFTNTSPVTVPTRSKMPALGTNPVSVTAPGLHGDDFELDMATSAVALGKIEVALMQDKKVPVGCGLTKDAEDTDDPRAILGDSYRLLPLGSREETGSYKGYGLAMAVEVLTSVLSGGIASPHVRRWKDTVANADLSQTFVALDPDVFADGFSDRLTSLTDHLRSLPPVGNKDVLVAGDPEKQHMAMCDEAGGIPYHGNQITLSRQMAQQYGVTPMDELKK